MQTRRTLKRRRPSTRTGQRLSSQITSPGLSRETFTATSTRSNPRPRPMTTYSETDLPPIDGLTSQPFFPKLRPINYVHQNARRFRILAVLLAVMFLGAQFHFCADLNTAPDSHFCPVCSAASSAVVAHAPSI